MDPDFFVCIYFPSQSYLIYRKCLRQIKRQMVFQLVLIEETYSIVRMLNLSKESIETVNINPMKVYLLFSLNLKISQNCYHWG